MRFFWRTLILASALIGNPGFAESQFKVIHLQYSSAEELIPLLRPHLPPDATLSGQEQSLVVKADAATLQELSALISELDWPPQALRISVRTERHATHSQSGLGADRSAIVRSNRDRDGAEGEFTVQALANRPAHIGRAVYLPVTERSIVTGRAGVSYHERQSYIHAADGFYATARTHGDRVTVALSVASGVPSDLERPYARREVVTQVSGPLGEWILIGASGGHRHGQEGRIVHSTRSRAAGEGRIWLKVELLDR